jgi:NAD(P)-dependent dehydrogenase (short-subunit alcohol dehydrogenase family)
MNKVLIVTGASGGIGAEIALLAGEYGYSICINYNNNESKALDIYKELKSKGYSVITVKADVSKESDVISMFAETKEKLGNVTALVNNAGIITPISKLESMNKARLQKVFDINVIGSFLCAKEAVKSMSLKNGGKGGGIVNISSIAATLGSPNEFIDYAATKGAIDTLTIGLAKEVAEEGIRVNAVRPGLIETEMHAHAGDPDRPEKLKEFIPLKRAGKSSEVANAVLWLLSDSASYVTGSLLDVSGGR